MIFVSPVSAMALSRRKTMQTVINARRQFIPGLIISAIMLSGAAASAAVPVPVSYSGKTSAFDSLPLRFEPNRGQAARSARYVAHGRGYALALTQTGVALELTDGAHHTERRIETQFVGAN